MASTPIGGDIVVQKRIVAPERLTRFDVGVFGHSRQYSEETYERALNRADSFARSAQVDVWYSEDGSVFRSITRRRPRAAS